MLLIDKPAGPTSHDVVARVRRALGTRAVGHAGTLDPFATGLLVVLVGRATRLARFVGDQPKRYRAVVRLGSRTDTDDPTGEPREGGPAAPPDDAAPVRAALAGLVGTQAQVPPAYSAKKVAGERSYRRARRGEAAVLAPVEVTVHDARLLAYAAPEATIEVTVSAGTYVRAIGRDLGEALGCGGHLTALTREAIGALDLAQAVPLDAVNAADLHPPALATAHLPQVALDAGQAEAVRHGRPIATAGPATAGHAALLEDGALLAVARQDAGRWQPEVVLAG